MNKIIKEENPIIIGNLFIWKNQNKKGSYYTYSKKNQKTQKWEKLFITEEEHNKLTGEQ